jgi:hypothetical protein
MSHAKTKQQSMGFAEPRALAAAEISGHGESLVEDFLRPLAGFGVASLRLQEKRVVVVGLGDGGDLRGLLKKCGGFFRLSGVSVGVSQQAFGAVEIVVGLGGYDALKVGYGGREISQLDFRDGAAIEGIGVVGAGRDSFVEGGAGAAGIPVVEIEQSEFFVVSGGGIVEDGVLEFANAAAARKNLEFGAEQTGVGDDFDGDVDQGAEPAANQDDKKPIRVRTTTDEMDDGESLENESPPVEEESHGMRNIACGGGLRASVVGLRPAKHFCLRASGHTSALWLRPPASRPFTLRAF